MSYSFIRRSFFGVFCSSDCPFVHSLPIYSIVDHIYGDLIHDRRCESREWTNHRKGLDRCVRRRLIAFRCANNMLSIRLQNQDKARVVDNDYDDDDDDEDNDYDNSVIKMVIKNGVSYYYYHIIIITTIIIIMSCIL